MYIRKITVKGHDYFQLVESYREDGKKKLRIIQHLGPTRPASMAGLTNGLAIPKAHEPETAPAQAPEPSVLPDSFPDVGAEPPFSLCVYAFKPELLGIMGSDQKTVKGWRIKGRNLVFWPTDKDPRNFLTPEEARAKIRELSGREVKRHGKKEPRATT